MKTSNLFGTLTESAIEFLRESVAEVEPNPQRSLISFATAIELFLKARLLREHWTLVHEKPQLARLGDFTSGDFVSVNLRECATRLENICSVRIPPNGLRQFLDIQKHRNKLIHFFHPDLTRKAKTTLREKVVSDELRGWVHLMRLLKSPDFRDHFQSKLSQIERIERQMFRNRRFLREKYKIVLPEVKEARKGAPAVECGYCEFDATLVVDDTLPLRVTECRVCELSTSTVLGTCRGCKALVETDCGEGKCGKCGKALKLKDLIEEYGDLKSPKDEMIEPSVAFCGECSEQAVVCVEDRWVCLYCGSIHSQTGECGHCGCPITGDDDHTSLTGCSQCDGPNFGD